VNLFSRFFHNHQNKSRKAHEKSGFLSENHFDREENFSIFDTRSLVGDGYLYNAWVNIAVDILIRNIARADFVVMKGGSNVTSGQLYELFRRPNPALSGYDLWKETAAWWYLEGEAFWWFGPDYSGGLPKEIYVLNPQKLTCDEEGFWGTGIHNNRCVGGL
jgi:phage portal protein BeeE